MNRLKEILAQIDSQKQPPVDKWHPENIGTIDIRIDAQGFWFHEGDPIQREDLVRLFASILWFEDKQHYLVTPVEKLAIQVEDVPYVVHQMEYVEDRWVAVTNTHEQVVISTEHPVELRSYKEQWIPYVRIRYDLWARVNRSIYYQWVTVAMNNQKNDDESLVLVSADYQFEVAKEQ